VKQYRNKIRAAAVRLPAQLIGIEDVCKKYSCNCTVKTAGKPSQSNSNGGREPFDTAVVAKYADHCVPRTYLQQWKYGNCVRDEG
jgi:hypothetical protein